MLRVRFPRSHEAAAFGKAVERIVPNRVEQVVARVGARERDGDDGLVDERAEQLDHCHLVEAVVGACLDECGERRTASVHRDMVEQRLLVRVQEVVAPLDERREGGAAGIGGRPIAEQLQAPRDEGEDLRETEHVDPRGGELDREREAVHETADLGGEPGVLVRRLEARASRARTRDEELHRRSGDCIARIGVVELERVDDDSHLSDDMEHLAAGGEHPHVRALGEECRDDARGLLDDVRAPVEEEDRVGVTKARDGARERVGAPHVEGLGCETNDVGALAARARSTCHAPSRSSLSTDRTASRASRLFPTPGGPVSVTRRCSRRSSATCASSASRPMNEVEDAGRLPRRRGAAGTGAIAGS